MKYYILILSIVTYSHFAFSKDMPVTADGIVNIEGMVVNQTCVTNYDNDHEETTISKHNNNDIDDGFNFNVLFEECITDIKKNIDLGFTGIKDIKDVNAFKAGSNKNGIAIVITDIYGKPFLPNTNNRVVLDKNKEKVDMVLKYKSTQKKVVPSPTNSKLLIRVIYP
ncbi:fimbrial protein [Photobacterium leiognathi]|uniref:fimbrial protein n=1 Tax=Photobacterium leiognathi TaxID=553611 RepID=UPI00273668D7|nr:fimbrial protein [Photobacterium leiognathi]